MNFLSFLAASAGANGAKLVMDIGGWDSVFELAAERRLIPSTPLGKGSIVGALFLVGAFTEWKIGESTVGSKFLSEILGDAPSELGSRILTRTPRHHRVIDVTPTNLLPAPPRRSLSQSITDGMNEITARLKRA